MQTLVEAEDEDNIPEPDVQGGNTRRKRRLSEVPKLDFIPEAEEASQEEAGSPKKSKRKSVSATAVLQRTPKLEAAEKKRPRKMEAIPETPPVHDKSSKQTKRKSVSMSAVSPRDEALPESQDAPPVETGQHFDKFFSKLGF